VVTRFRSGASAMVVAALAAVVGMLAACGSEIAQAPGPKPATAGEYRGLSEAGRLAAAAGCRDRAARQAEGVAARQIADVDERLLLQRLDLAVADARKRARFDRTCTATLRHRPPEPPATGAAFVLAGGSPASADVPLGSRI
jgi:hypothetical protein